MAQCLASNDLHCLMQGGMLKSIRAGLQTSEGRESYNNKLAFRQRPFTEVPKIYCDALVQSDIGLGIESIFRA